MDGRLSKRDASAAIDEMPKENRETVSNQTVCFFVRIDHELKRDVVRRAAVAKHRSRTYSQVIA